MFADSTDRWRVWITSGVMAGVGLLLAASPAFAASNPSLVPSLPSITAMQNLGAASPLYPNVIVTDVGNFHWGSACTPDTINTFAATGVSSTVGCWYLQEAQVTNLLLNKPIGVFANTQMNLVNYSTVQGASASDIYHGSHASTGYASEALTAAIIDPSTSAQEVHAIGGYIESFNTTWPGLGIQTECDVKVNNGRCWGGVMIARSTDTITGAEINGLEIDTNPASASDGGFSVLAAIGAVNGTTGTFNGNAFATTTNTPGLIWGAAFDAEPASASFGFRIEPSCATGTCDSPTNRLSARLSGTNVNVDESAGSDGSLNVTAGVLNFLTSASRALIVNSSNASGGEISLKTSGTEYGDVGSAAQIFSGGSTSDLGIGVIGSHDIYLGNNGTPLLSVGHLGITFPNAPAAATSGSKAICLNGTVLTVSSSNVCPP